jgi:hypothetical protein
MTERLDFLVGQLASAPADRVLDQLETDVLRRVRRAAADARAASSLAPVRAASIALALAMGVVAGGASAISAAAAPTQATGLAVGDHLAPSNLLENGR